MASGTVLLLIVFMTAVNTIWALPSDQICGGSATWIRGNPYNQMNVGFFSTATNKCKMTISPNVASYTPGQEFIVTTSVAPNSLAYKVETVGGAQITPGSGGVLATAASDCANFVGRKPSVSFKVTAPTEGADIYIRALCGTEDYMYIANEVRLTAGEGVKPLPDQNGVSTDPNYSYQNSLTSGLLFRHARNDTHARFKMEYTGTGYVAIGLGTAMIGSTVLVGVDTTVNPTMPGVGLYDIVSKTGTTSNIVATGAALGNYGITDASYVSVNGVSSLMWTVILAKQTPKFTMVPSPIGTKVQLVWAQGPPEYVQHDKFGFSQNFEAGVAPVVPPNPPAPGGGRPSSDPLYTFETSLGSTAVLQYKSNSTHGMFKIQMSSQGYLAFGPGTLMLASTVLIGMDPSANPGFPAIGLYTLQSKTASPSGVGARLASTPSELAKYGISDAVFSSASGVSQLRFSLEMASQLPVFTLFPKSGGPVNAIWAAGPPTYSMHTSYGFVTQIDFTTGTGGSTGADVLDYRLVGHIISMIMAWEIFSPLGVVIPLFNNVRHGMPGLCRISAPKWLLSHWVILTIGCVLGYIGTLLGYLYVDSIGSAHWASNHADFGLAILLFSIVQPLWGAFRPKKSKTGEKKNKLRMFFEYGHRLFGYFIVACGLANCMVGVTALYKDSGGQDYVLGGSQSATGFGGAMGVVIIVFCAFWSFVIVGGWYRSFFNWATTASPVLASNPKLEKRIIDHSELHNHSTENDCWVVYKNRVYDVTEFLSIHPGGKSEILPYAGKDITEAFNGNGHSDEALALLSKYLIGELQHFVPADVEAGLEEAALVDAAGGAAPSDPNKFLCGDSSIYREVKVIEKIPISHNVFKLKLGLPSKTMVLNLPIGKHIAIIGPNVTGQVPGEWNGKKDFEAGRAEIQRKYTPITTDKTDQGYFTIITKVYRPNAQAGFPDGGKMGRYLDGLKLGDTMTVAGPIGPHQYLGNGRFLDKRVELKATNIGMVAGGSGLTPMWQLATAMLSDPLDPCKISLVYANTYYDDILMKDELLELEKKHPGRFRVWFTLSNKPEGKEWQYSLGRVNKEMLSDKLPAPTDDSLIVSCGPKPMMECVATILAELGFHHTQRIDY